MSYRRRDPYHRKSSSVVHHYQDTYYPEAVRSSIRLGALDSARSLIRSLEDRRTFHPLGVYRPVSSLVRSSSRVVMPLDPGEAGRPYSFPHTLNFAVPKDVAICVRRKERRSVLIAKGKTRSRKPKTRNWWSMVRC